MAAACGLLVSLGVVVVRPRRIPLSVIGAVYLLVLLALLLKPVEGLSGGVSLVPFVEMWRSMTAAVSAQVPLVQLVGNVLLFVPFGLLAPARVIALRRGWRV